MTQPTSKPTPPRRAGRIRRFIAWVMVFIGINPGFKPWEDDSTPPQEK